MLYLVWGGRFKDTTWREFLKESEETAGPFSDREEAVKVWSAMARRHMDDATHRVFLLDLPIGGAAGRPAEQPAIS